MTDPRDEGNQQIVDWVSTIPYATHHHTARKKLAQYPNAAEWVDTKYSEWMASGEPQVLWIRGTVGSGKTSVVSRIVESFYSRLDEGDPRRMIYFYCVSAVTPEDIIRSLIAQLAWKEKGSSVEKIVLQRCLEFYQALSSTPSLADWLILLQELCSKSVPLTLVIDGLDECQDASSLLAGLKTYLRTSGPDHIRFLFSSRMHIDVLEYFPDIRIVETTKTATQGDMATYIEQEVKSREKDFDCGESNSEDEKLSQKKLSEDVIRVLSNSASGM